MNPDLGETNPFAPLTLSTRLVLIRGVIRRLLLNLFRPGYVRASIARRQGDCRRCGVCCHLIANRCGALHLFRDGHSTCRLYNVYRLPNCRTFPIDPRDLTDRDLVMPDEPCGFSWSERQPTPES